MLEIFNFFAKLGMSTEGMFPTRLLRVECVWNRRAGSAKRARREIDLFGFLLNQWLIVFPENPNKRAPTEEGAAPQGI